MPGMVATTEIRTGRKTVLAYLLKPLNRAAEAVAGALALAQIGHQPVDHRRIAPRQQAYHDGDRKPRRHAEGARSDRIDAEPAVAEKPVIRVKNG